MDVTSIRGRSLIPTILCKWLRVRRGEGEGGQSRWMFCLLISVLSGETSPASPALAINLSCESLLLPPVHLILILRQSFKARLYKYRLVKLITRPSRPATLIRSEQPGFNRKIRAGMCWQWCVLLHSLTSSFCLLEIGYHHVKLPLVTPQ